MTPSHDNLTSSKTPDMGDLAHPESPRPSRNDAKKFTFDCISPVASINISDSRDVQNSKAEKADAVEESKGELRDVPMETAAEATEDDKLAVVEEGVGSDDPTVAGLVVKGTSGQDEATPNSWYFCGMDPTDLLTLTTFEASMKYLATASAGVETTETKRNGKESEPSGEETVTTKCQDNLEAIEATKTAEAKIDPVVAETLEAACNRLLNPVANALEGGDEESLPLLNETYGSEAGATVEPIAPESIDTLRFVYSDIELAPSDEMENRSAAVSPTSQKKAGLCYEMRETGVVCFDNLKAFHAYV
jgi:hypothetical protein